MCLHKTHRFPKKAKEDIIVYKVMGNYSIGFISPYYSDDNVYKPTDMMYSSHLPMWGIFKKFITSEGVHCFSNKSTAYNLAKREACLSFHYSVLICEIPKGTLYYEGINNEVAAGKLKLLKVLDSFPTQENIEEAMRERELEQRKWEEKDSVKI